MPTAQQGDIHDYDFRRPVIGAELSGRRPTLVISDVIRLLVALDQLGGRVGYQRNILT